MRRWAAQAVDAGADALVDQGNEVVGDNHSVNDLVGQGIQVLDL
jgi:hypothetical protein